MDYSTVPFSRPDVVDAMDAIGVEPSHFTGDSRKEHPASVMNFETFYTLSNPIDYFAKAMQIELEHGTAAGDVGADITQNDLYKTAMIAKAHLYGVEYGEKPPYDMFPAYYDYLMWIEYIKSQALKKLSIPHPKYKTDE